MVMSYGSQRYFGMRFSSLPLAMRMRKKTRKVRCYESEKDIRLELDLLLLTMKIAKSYASTQRTQKQR